MHVKGEIGIVDEVMTILSLTMVSRLEDEK